MASALARDLVALLAVSVEAPTHCSERVESPIERGGARSSMRGGAQRVVGGETGFDEAVVLARHHGRLDGAGLVEHVLRSLQLMGEVVLYEATKRVRVGGTLHLVDERALVRRQRRELGPRLQCLTGIELRGCPWFGRRGRRRFGRRRFARDGRFGCRVGRQRRVRRQRGLGRQRGVGRERGVGCGFGGSRRIGVVGECGQAGQRHEQHTQQREDADEGQHATPPTATLARPFETATVHRFSPSPEGSVSQMSRDACSASLQVFGHK